METLVRPRPYYRVTQPQGPDLCFAVRFNIPSLDFNITLVWLASKQRSGPLNISTVQFELSPSLSDGFDYPLPLENPLHLLKTLDVPISEISTRDYPSPPFQCTLFVLPGLVKQVQGMLPGVMPILSERRLITVADSFTRKPEESK